MELEVGDVVLCTVEKVERTIVFVKIDGNGDGSIITSEIAPGRIRNIRDYVVPKKTIVCKVLRIANGRIDLSLRRVTPKEKKEVMEQLKLEKSYKSVLKGILKEKAKEVIAKISEKERLFDFLEEAKKDPKDLEKIVGKTEAKKVLDILKTQKQKKAILKREIKLTTTEPNGITLIKNILKKIKDAEVKYISAGRYTIQVESDNIKDADHKLQEILSTTESEAKKNKIEFYESKKK